MKSLSITADQIQIGDQLQLGEWYSKNPNFRWVDVKKIRYLKSKPNQVMITARGQEFTFGVKDAVSVERFDNPGAWT